MSTSWSAPNRTSVSRRAGSSPRSSSTGGRSPDIRPAERVGLAGELLADLREHLDALIDVARPDHQQRRLERERRRRDALHRPVVQVARDAVALGFDRGVRAPHQPAAVLVAVLQELEQRPDRLVGDPRRGHVAHEQQGAWRSRRHGGRARLEVQHLPVGARDLRLPARSEAGERVVRADDHRGQRRPRLILDRLARQRDHLGERLVRPQHDASLVELDDAVLGGLEDEPQVLLGLAERLVGLAHAFERLVGLGQRAFPLFERLGGLSVRDRARRLVREDARRDAEPEQQDDRGRLGPGEAALVVEDRHHGERRAGRDHREAREHRSGPASRRGRRRRSPSRGCR